MRNYYLTMEASRDSSAPEIVDKIQLLSDSEPDIANKAHPIVLVEHRKRVYDQVHLQFEAIGLAYQAFQTEIKDTNDWNRRLVEFIPPAPPTE